MKLLLLSFSFMLNASAFSMSQQARIEIATYDDFEGQHSKQEMFLVTSNNRRILIQASGENNLKDKNGKWLKHNQLVEFDQTTDKNSIQSNELTIIESKASESIQGARSSLLIVANFKDREVPCSLSEIEEGIYGSKNSVDQLFKEVSGGQSGVTKDASLEITIPASATDACAPFTWTALAEKEAVAAGIDPTKYQQLLYAFPKTTCGYSGVTAGRRAITLKCNVVDVIAHEFGHSLGMNHAQTPENEYGDVSDIMGYTGVGLRGLNGPHKVQMNWMEPSQAVTLSGEGRVTVAALNQSAGHAGGPQVYRIPRNDGSSLYLSYRQPLGFDQGAGADSFKGVSIHSWKGGSAPTILVSMLKNGQTFFDPRSGATIKQNSFDTSGVYLGASIAGVTTIGAPVKLVGSVSRSGFLWIKKYKVNLKWEAPKDGAKVKDYLVLKNGSLVATVTSLNYSDSSVSKSNSYKYTIISRNLEGKYSPESNLVNIVVSK